MMSLKNITTISTFEAKVLWRNWFFRIVALLGLGFITIFNLAVFSELDTPDWRGLSNSFILPYATLLMIAIPQVAAVVFLASGLIKKDKKLDTNEVFFVRPISNLDYVLGKALALFKLFFLLNAVLLLIPFVVALTSPLATFNLTAFLVYPLLTSVPSIVFTTGASFLLVTIIRNQPITIVLFIGLAGVELIYYFDQFSNILDFMAFRLPMLGSEITGFVDMAFPLWHRAFYFITGVACLFLTAFLLDRLASNKSSQRVTVLIGTTLLVLAAVVMVRLWDIHKDVSTFRKQMVSVNGKWTSVPNIDILSHGIDLRWTGGEISSASTLTVRNNTNRTLDTIYFTLNPGLEVSAVLVNGEPVVPKRDMHIVFLDQTISLAPGKDLKIWVKYEGTITEAAAHPEVDMKRYESANNYLMFSLRKKYAYLEPDYLALTKDVLWYPDTEVGYNLRAVSRGRRSFTSFELKVTPPPGKLPVSQGKVTENEGSYSFLPDYPLPQISLVIGEYAKKEIVVKGVTYAVFHHPRSDFFIRHLDQLADTVAYLIEDVVDEYEDAQNIAYPFSRLQFVEVPLHFFGYSKIYESNQAYLQPEMVFWPEEGGGLKQFDFRRQLRDMGKQASRSNQVLTDKQKQANVFNDLVRKVFTKQIGSRWVYDGQDHDRPDYSIFPNYYDFNSGVVSDEWTLLNRSIGAYLRNDKQVQNDYSRNINGISFTEECNMQMRTSALTDIITTSDFGKVTKSVSLKSEYLFSYLGQTIGENRFKEFLYQWVNEHQHQLSGYDDFRKAIVSAFGLDIDPVIQKVFSQKSQAAFELLDLQKYEVMDGDRKRYQVMVKVKNSGDIDGVIEIKFDTKEKGGDDDYWSEKLNEEAAEDEPGRLSVVKQGQTKLFGFLLDEKPKAMSVNTIISQNIPSVISMSIGALSQGEAGDIFDGERVLEPEEPSDEYELIVDNEDRGFSSFSPVEPTMLKAFLDSRNPSDQKYYGSWSRSYSKWLATTGSDFYGKVIRSAHFTGSGSGEKVATWTPALKHDGFYDIYVYMRGKNQNEFQGSDKDNRQFNYHYTVKNADGVDNLTFNISRAEPGWNYLGSYYFTRAGGSVSLTDECELRTVYADAVKWVRQ